MGALIRGGVALRGGALLRKYDNCRVARNAVDPLQGKTKKNASNAHSRKTCNTTISESPGDNCYFSTRVSPHLFERHFECMTLR